MRKPILLSLIIWILFLSIGFSVANNFEKPQKEDLEEEHETTPILLNNTLFDPQIEPGNFSSNETNETSSLMLDISQDNETMQEDPQINETENFNVPELVPSANYNNSLEEEFTQPNFNNEITGDVPCIGGGCEAMPVASITQIKEKTYIYALGRIVASIEDSNINYYHQDALGSVIAISDESGDIVYQTEYIPFGETIMEEGNSSYKYTGKEKDNDLYYYGARYYDASLGRFLQPDPILRTDESPYIYAKNSPLINIDPDGRDTWNALLWYNIAKAQALSLPQQVAVTTSVFVDYGIMKENTAIAISRASEHLSNAFLNILEPKDVPLGISGSVSADGDRMGIPFDASAEASTEIGLLSGETELGISGDIDVKVVSGNAGVSFTDEGFQYDYGLQVSLPLPGYKYSVSNSNHGASMSVSEEHISLSGSESGLKMSMPVYSNGVCKVKVCTGLKFNDQSTIHYSDNFWNARRQGDESASWQLQKSRANQ